MSRCALLRSMYVSVVSKRVISENFALKNFIDFPSLGQDRELKKPKFGVKLFVPENNVSQRSYTSVPVQDPTTFWDR